MLLMMLFSFLLPLLAFSLFFKFPILIYSRNKLFLDWAFMLCCVQDGSVEFLMKFLCVYFYCMPNDEALL